MKKKYILLIVSKHYDTKENMKMHVKKYFSNQNAATYLAFAFKLLKSFAISGFLS